MALIFQHHQEAPKGPILRQYHRRKIKIWLKRIFIVGVFAVLAFAIYLVGAVAWYSRYLPDPNKILERNVAQSTKIYDRTGETVLYDLHGDVKRTLVKLSDIPDIVKEATISAEDKTFYTNKGFNPLSMIKGVVIDPLLGKSMRGGSTITQQLVKNAILTNERSIARKIKELVLSYRIEASFSKDDILQMYLNEIPYGSVVYGVQSASQTYFGKNVQDLSLAEVSVLVAIPQAPTYYSPFGTHQDALFTRQKYVLNQLVANGYITDEQRTTALQEKIVFAVKREPIIAPHFVMYVKQLLVDQFGEDMVSSGGLKVITTLDLKKQDIAETAVTNGVDARGKQYGFSNAALVSLDPRTGQILAMVGSKDYFDIENDGNVNVTLSLRQPGSSIKPFIYAEAFKKGYTPNTILYDVSTVFKTETRDYAPKNYDQREHGPLNMRTALGHSLNIPAVKTLYLDGISNVLDMLEQAGYTSFGDRSRFGLSLVLGGGEVKLLEHTAGYGIFATSGTYHQPAAILEVADSHGNILFQYKDQAREVFEAQIANMITNVLSDTSVRLSVNMTLPDRPNAGKTGTTNDFKDAWMMGYTPSLVTGVWVGNNMPTPMKGGADGTVIAAPIWKEYMTKALAGTFVEQFPAVEIPITGKPVLDGDPMSPSIVKIDKYTGKLATEFTPAEAITEMQVRQAHNILQYVDKDNPTGPIPSNPSDDPQYANWEAGVQDWLRRTGQATSEDVQLPTQYDDVHTQANKPTVFITNPTQSQTINSTMLTANVSVSAPRGVTRVEYYLDNKLLQVVNGESFNLSYPLVSYFVNGNHRLRAIAFDDVNNYNEASVDITIQTSLPRPNLIWHAPQSGATVYSVNFPMTIFARLTDLDSSGRVDFYQKKVDSGQINLFATVNAPQQNDIQASWPAVFEKGDYELYAEITDANGNQYETERIGVSVN